MMDYSEFVSMLNFIKYLTVIKIHHSKVYPRPCRVSCTTNKQSLQVKQLYSLISSHVCLV
jgi:hypothetical protein